VDNGSAFIDSSLERACAVLGMKLTHSAPSRPMGRGKIERVFGVIQQQFLVEISGDPDGGSPARHPAASLEELNGLLAAWLRTVYHARPHSETGQAPAARLAAGGEPALPDPALLKEAFSWSVIRQVRKTATVSVEGNVYSLDPFLTGRKVECVFDPFDMTELTVYWQGRKVGRAVPQVIGRHAHPKAPPDEDDPAPAEPAGIDYLQLVADADAAALAGELRLSALDDSEPDGEAGDSGQDGEGPR
jgi:putative transposase